MSNSSLSFGAACPPGSEWYTCQNSPRKFAGCCASNPCGTTMGCPDKDLRPATFNKTWYGKFCDQLCESDSAFYTCASTKPSPFMGCCKRDINYKCGGSGCPADSLRPMMILGDDFLGSGPAWDRGPCPSLHTDEPTPSPTKPPLESAVAGKDSGIGTDAIVGIVVGSFVAVLVLTAGLTYLCGYHARGRKGRKRKTPTSSLSGSDWAYPRLLHSEGSHSPQYSPYSDRFPINAGPYHGHAHQDQTSTLPTFDPRYSPVLPMAQVHPHGHLAPPIPGLLEQTHPAYGLGVKNVPPPIQELDSIEHGVPAELDQHGSHPHYGKFQ